MGDDVKTFCFNHFKTLFPETGDGFLHVHVKKLLEAGVVDFSFGTIDEPDAVIIKRTHEVYPTDDIVQIEMLLIIRKRLGHAGDEVAFQPIKKLEGFLLQFKVVNFLSIVGDHFLPDAKFILKRDGGVGREAQFVVMKFIRFPNKIPNRLLSVAIGGVGMEVAFHVQKVKRALILRKL